MPKTILIIIAGGLIVIVGGYFLLRGRYQAPTASTSTLIPPPLGISAPEREGASTPEVKEITVVGTEFSFSSSSITVSAGEQVKITFRNEGRAPHNLVLEGLGVTTKTISGGQTDTIEFTAPALGTYTFICSVPGHRAAGMEGSLVVE